MPSRTTKAKLVGLAAGVAALPGLLLAGSEIVAAAPGSSTAARPVPVPDSIKALGLDKQGSLAPALRGAKGTVTVSVALSERPLAATVAEGAVSAGSLPSKASQQSQTAAVRAQQDGMIGEARSLGATAVGRATTAANVVAVTIPATRLADLAKIPGVLSVKPVARYQTQADPGGSGSLAQAADYVQATSVRAQGFDGTGIKVAVLDSGVDYTHEYLGGPGTEAFYKSCYARRNIAPTGGCANYFGPSAPKVKGGFDFVGEAWPDKPEAPDPHPIDFEGHGTHVSDIIGGRSADGTHKGIAPGVDLYAVKVCSAVSTACSGVALLQGVDWVLDPNGDGSISDAMDIMNMSLGTSYGQEQDDVTAAVDNAVRAGVVGVMSAGNAADRPFIVGAPSTAARAISVAQTALPDDKLYSIRVNSPTIPGLPDNTIRNSKLQSWSPAPTAVLTAPLGQPAAPFEGCTAAAFAGFPAGAIALVKRGTCNASLKAQNAQAAGASAVVIWNNVPGDPPDFSFGGGSPVTVPTLTISQANGQRLSTAVSAGAVGVTIDPAATTPLTNTTVGTSSRGPAISGIRPKPDIGAPGAWLSAEVGTGSGQTNFGGTSGAAPVVSGAAALLLDKLPRSSPAIVKSRLLNGASTANRTPDANADFYPTPITRVGAGEVRVAPSADAAGVLTNGQVGSGNIGLGLPHLTVKQSFDVRLTLRNTGPAARTYLLSPEFRDPAEAAAVTVTAPASVPVPANSSSQLTVRVTVDPSVLPRWPFTHAAGRTGDGSQLNAPEVDGYLKAVAGDETLHLGWTVLPHRSADVSTSSSVRLRNGSGSLSLQNNSQVLEGGVNVFGLTGTSPKLPKPGPGAPGTPGSNAAVVDLAAAGVRDDASTGALQFAIAGQQRKTVPLYPAGYEVDIDVDRDGDVDYAVFQQEAGGFATSGQSVVYVFNVATGAATAYFYTDADFDVSTQVLSAPLAALGLTNGSTFDFSVLAYDNYFTGLVTDVIDGQTWTVGSAKYALADGADSLVVPAGQGTQVTVSQNSAAGPTTQSGLLLLYDDAATSDAQAVRVS